MGYERLRRPDPRIANALYAQLRSARTLLNVGAGTGSYEPRDRYVLAVEPSAAMRARRAVTAAVPAIDATAEALPFVAIAASVLGQGGQVIGVGNLDRRQDPPITRKLHVRPERHGAGVGTALLERVGVERPASHKP